MRKTSRTTRFSAALLLFILSSFNGLAKSPPVILNLSGVGAGDVVTLGGYGTDIQLVGDEAYVTLLHQIDTNYPGRLTVFSLANPIKPLRLGSYESRTPANSVYVTGRFAYLAGGTARTLTNDPGTVEIVDVSDPANPKLTGGIGARGRANAIRVVGGYAYVAESRYWTGTQLVGALEIFDVSDPTAPLRVATFDTAGSATSVEVSNGYAYLADGVTDLQVLDVSNPTNPIRVGVYKSDTTQNHCGFESGGPATFVQVVGNVAYSAGDNGLKVLDISDPTQPVLIGDNFCFPIQSLCVSGRNVYAAIWLSVANSYSLALFDASDPANLVAVGSEANWGSPVFQVAGKWIYLATDSLSVYQTSGRPATKPQLQL